MGTPLPSTPFSLCAKNHFPKPVSEQLARWRSRPNPHGLERPRLLIAFALPGVWGKMRVTWVYLESWALISWGTCSPFTGLSKPQVLQIVAEKPAVGLAKAKYPPLSIFRLLIFPFIHVFSVFQPVGIGPRTDRPGSFQRRSHGRGLDSPC